MADVSCCQSAVTIIFLTKKQVAVICFVSQRVNRLKLTSEKMISRPFGADLRSFTSFWPHSRPLARIAGVSSCLWRMTLNSPPNFTTAYPTFVAQHLVSMPVGAWTSRDCFYWSPGSYLDLPHWFSHWQHPWRHLLYRPCASGPRRRLGETYQDALRCHLQYVRREEVQKVALICLAGKTFWSIWSTQK